MSQPKELTPIEREALKYRRADVKKLAVSSIIKTKGELDRTAINKLRKLSNNIKGAAALNVATPEQIQEKETADKQAKVLQTAYNTKFKSEITARKLAGETIKDANQRLDIMFEAVGYSVSETEQ